MNKNNELIQQITSIGESSFQKLKELNIPPYPKYYHDTFMDELSASQNPTLIDLSKKYSYLFNSNENEENLNEVSFELAKNSLKEFEKSNTNLKNISDENFIDISSIKKEYDSVHTQEVINVFGTFQNKIITELKNADETITKLKLEIERLERESHIDPLTKAYNRRVFGKDLQEIINAVSDKNVDFQLIMFDADDFKKVNDAYGHLAGDKTLIFLVKLLQSAIRKGTKIYRYGGEEFVLLLNRVTLDETEKTVARIIKETDESKLLYKGHNIHLTLSAGIASYKKGDTPEDILERADRALYEAKSSGKNCYRIGE